MDYFIFHIGINCIQPRRGVIIIAKMVSEFIIALRADIIHNYNKSKLVFHPFRIK
jgi:hypothetical protein